MRLGLFALLLTFTLLHPIHGEAAVPSSEAQPLSFLSDLRSENTHSLRDLNEALEKATLTAEVPSDRLVFLTQRKKELETRQIFLNRLILQFDLKFKGGDLQAFLKMALNDMSQIETSSMKPFLVELLASVESLPKGQVDVLQFVEGYMKRCSFERPMPAEEYLSSLDYYNGVQAQKAHGMSALQAIESTF